MSVNTPTIQPAAWLGCLHCYASGSLAGRWFPCDGIEDVTLADVHGGPENVRESYVQLLALDTEHSPSQR